MGKESTLDREDPQQPSAQQGCSDWASCKAVFLSSVRSPRVNETPTSPHLVLMRTDYNFSLSFIIINSFFI